MRFSGLAIMATFFVVSLTLAINKILTTKLPTLSNITGSQVLSSVSNVLGAQSDQKSFYKLSVTKLVSGQTNTVTLTKRITVYLNLENDSDSVLQVSPGLQMQLADQANKLYSVTANYLVANEVIGGPLVSKTSTHLAIDFDIPQYAIPTQLIYQPDGSVPQTRIHL